MTTPAIPTRHQLERAGIKVVVAIPMERQVPFDAFYHFWAIATRGYKVLPHPYGRTDVQRNIIGNAIKKLPAKEITHVCMLDLDHQHPSDVVERLARWVLQDKSRLVVGGLNFRRGAPYDPCIFMKAPDGEMRPPIYWDEGLMQVDAIGHGAILISREIFDRVPGPWWQYTYMHFDKEVFPSEDIYFSALMEFNNIGVYCDTTTTSPHLISATVDEAVFRRYMDDHPEKMLAFAQEDEEAPPAPAQGNSTPNFLKKAQGAPA